MKFEREQLFSMAGGACVATVITSSANMLTGDGVIRAIVSTSVAGVATLYMCYVNWKESHERR